MPNHSDLNPSDWSWLPNTYWYVQTENLPALQFDPDNKALAWVVDQTVWHITGYRNGYFWGVSATVVQPAEEAEAQRRDRSRPVCFAMLGTITPEGRVHLTFVLDQSSAASSATIGIGCAVERRGKWSLEMQMSSGNNKRTAHWAYMTQTRPGDSSWEDLPGVGISVPEMLQGCEPPKLNVP